jgi:hypothetical protein
MNPKNLNAAQQVIAGVNSKAKTGSATQNGVAIFTRRKLLLVTPVIVLVVTASIIYPLAGVLMLPVVFVFLKKT